MCGMRRIYIFFIVMTFESLADEVLFPERAKYLLTIHDDV